MTPPISAKVGEPCQAFSTNRGRHSRPYAVPQLLTTANQRETAEDGGGTAVKYAFASDPNAVTALSPQ